MSKIDTSNDPQRDRSAGHTPTPWSCGAGYVVDEHDLVVADCIASALISAGTGVVNAAFIVKACNAHGALVSALREIEELHAETDIAGLIAARVIARAALSKLSV
jgi:hypothetical protein